MKDTNKIPLAYFGKLELTYWDSCILRFDIFEFVNSQREPNYRNKQLRKVWVQIKPKLREFQTLTDYQFEEFIKDLKNE